MIKKIQHNLDLNGNKHPYHLCGLPSQEVTRRSDEPYHLSKSINSFIHKDLIHLHGTGSLVWGIAPPTGQGVTGGSDYSHNTHYPKFLHMMGTTLEDCYFRHNDACRFLMFFCGFYMKKLVLKAIFLSPYFVVFFSISLQLFCSLSYCYRKKCAVFILACKWNLYCTRWNHCMYV